MRVQRSIDIEADRNEIWPFLVQPQKFLEWYVPMRRFEYRGPQSAGVGTAFYAEEEASGRLLKLNFEVTEWAENEKLAFRMTSGDFLKGYEQRFTLEPTRLGTRLTYVEDIKLPYGVLGGFLGVFAGTRSRATAGAVLEKLKGFAEESHGQKHHD